MSDASPPPEVDAKTRKIISNGIGGALKRHFPTEPLPERLQALLAVMAAKEKRRS